jgi:hypothetical protein
MNWPQTYKGSRLHIGWLRVTLRQASEGITNYEGVVYAMDHEVIPRPCKICVWLLNLSSSWDHFGLHQGRKCQSDHGVRDPQKTYLRTYFYPLTWSNKFCGGRGKRGFALPIIVVKQGEVQFPTLFSLMLHCQFANATQVSLTLHRQFANATQVSLTLHRQYANATQVSLTLHRQFANATQVSLCKFN